MRLWNVSNGKCLYTWEFPTAVKRVAFSADDSKIVCITEKRMGYESFVRVFEIDRESSADGTKQSEEPILQFTPAGSKPTVCCFNSDASAIVTGHENGKVATWDAVDGVILESNERAHTDVITDLQLSPDWTYVITASKDKTAKVRPEQRRLRLITPQAHHSLTPPSC